MTQRSLSINLAATAAFALVACSLALFARPENMAKKVSASETAMDSINSKNRTARSVFCPSIRTGIFNKSLIFYEKPNKMMFVSGSALRDEAIIGCDGSKYWFWMRSFDSGSLYFCDLDRLDRTPLIPLMRPEVVSRMAWIDEIEGEVTPAKDGFRAESTRGRFKKLVGFDSEKVFLQEVFVDDALVVSLRALEFGNFSGLMLPTKVEANWKEEGLSGVFVIDRWIVNARAPEISEPKGLRRRNLEKL